MSESPFDIPTDADAVVDADASPEAAAEGGPVADGAGEDIAVEDGAVEDGAVEDGAGSESPAVEADPVAELREALRTQPGDWYVVHSYAGYENRVKTNLENRIVSLNMEDYIYEVFVPQNDENEIKNGERRTVKKNTFPGYVLVRMDLTDESWSAVRNTPAVTGFVGHAHQPTPLTLDEVVTIRSVELEAPVEAKQAAGAQVQVLDFAEGDSVTVIDGPFAALQATIHEINTDSMRVKAFVEIFGRETPVELSFNQIQKN